MLGLCLIECVCPRLKFESAVAHALAAFQPEALVRKALATCPAG